MGAKAPLIHSICMINMLEYHLSVMVMIISSSDTIPNPNMAGNETKAVKRSILRNTRFCRSRSSDTLVSTGCATPFIMPEMKSWPMPHHLLAWL